MAQIFSPIANLLFRVGLLGAVLLVLGAGAVTYGFVRSAYVTGENIPRRQPVQFSHRHHVEGLGIDCRYCHTSVEESSFAGIPSTSICMNCHTEIWSESPMLAPVRQSYEEKEPLVWTRVYNLPDHAYFNHSAHVQSGIGCDTCHGEVDQNALMAKVRPMFMQWCLDCHRDPAQYIRPKDEVFNMNYERPENQIALGRRLVEEYDIRPPRELDDCYTCHR